MHGFSRNILDEQNEQRREQMLWYLTESMEDATDFSWGSAKAAHAVLLCEMESGVLSWSDTIQIDRIRRAHIQKHSNFRRQNLPKMLENKKTMVLQAVSIRSVSIYQGPIWWQNA